nr:immunoglobulin heavy chain junction region [Mus musculus]
CARVDYYGGRGGYFDVW